MVRRQRLPETPEDIVRATPHGGSATRTAMAIASAWRTRALRVDRWRKRSRRFERMAFLFGMAAGLEAIAITWLLLAGF